MKYKKKERNLKGYVIGCFMPTYLYLTAHHNAKWVRLLRSNFLAYQTSLGLFGGCEQERKKERYLKSKQEREIKKQERQE